MKNPPKSYSFETATCLEGHELSEANSLIKSYTRNSKTYAYRYCRACSRVYQNSMSRALRAERGYKLDNVDSDVADILRLIKLVSDNPKLAKYLLAVAKISIAK